jgi:hypothetical protein
MAAAALAPGLVGHRTDQRHAQHAVGAPAWAVGLFAAAALLAAAALVGTPVLPGVASGGLTGPAAALRSELMAPAEIDAILAYVDGMQPGDELVLVRPGVFAKRSNVEGIRLGGRTMYYDVYPHQSSGPLRTGRWSDADVSVLARIPANGTLVLIYTPNQSNRREL